MKEMSEIKSQNKAKSEGFVIGQCKATNHCPKAIVNTEGLAAQIADLAHSVKLDSLIRQKFGAKLAKHHIFSIVFSGCPNGCSRPQIQDIGIMATAKVAVNHQVCIACMRCISVCKEHAMSFDGREIVIDQDRCIGCGDCIRACPVSAVAQTDRAYRILAGGRLGRHPRLAEELYSFVPEEQVVPIVEKIIYYFRDFAEPHERLADVMARNGADELRKYIEKM